MSTRTVLPRMAAIRPWEDVPFLPLGPYDQPTAYRSELRNMLTGSIPFTGIWRR